MKKLIVILRFGASHPLGKEIPLFEKLLEANPEHGCAVGIEGVGLFSIIHTRFSPKEIAQEFAELAERTNDLLPVLVFSLDDPSVGVDLRALVGIQAAIKELRARIGEVGAADAADTAGTTIEMTLDELLDLVNTKGGVDRLSADERALLEKLSREEP